MHRCLMKITKHINKIYITKYIKNFKKDILKKNIFTAKKFFSSNVLSANSLKCVSMNNQECKIRPEIINLNTNEPPFILIVLK